MLEFVKTVIDFFGAWFLASAFSGSLIIIFVRRWLRKKDLRNNANQYLFTYVRELELELWSHPKYPGVRREKRGRLYNGDWGRAEQNFEAVFFKNRLLFSYKVRNLADELYKTLNKVAVWPDPNLTEEYMNVKKQIEDSIQKLKDELDRVRI